MKRLAMVTLAAVFLCNSNVQTTFAATQKTWASDAMQTAYDAGLISDTLRKKADVDITRLEFCKMAVQFYKKAGMEVEEVSKKNPFIDCDDEDVLLAYHAGFISGVSPNQFMPEKKLTRTELSILIVRLFHVCGIDLMPYAKEIPFSDTKNLSESTQKYIKALYGAGLISGYTDGSFQPNGTLKVQEATIVLNNARKFYEQKVGTAKKDDIQKKEAEQVSTKPEGTTDTKQESTSSISHERHHLILSGKKIALGQSKDEIKKTWGEPKRIDKTVYDLERYIYQPNHKEYLMVTLQDEKAIAIFAVADRFSYNGIENIRTLKDITAQSRFSNFSNYALWNTDDAEISFSVDFQGNIRGASLRETAFSIGEGLKISSDVGVYAYMEQELFESINTLRAIHEEKPLEWDVHLHESATEHSKDMIDKKYFAYNGLDGKTPFQRMKEKDKHFYTATEVIARAKGDVPELYTEMIRSAGKYHSILDETMSHGGIGIAIAITSHTANATVDICGFKK